MLVEVSFAAKRSEWEAALRTKRSAISDFQTACELLFACESSNQSQELVNMSSVVASSACPSTKFEEMRSSKDANADEVRRSALETDSAVVHCRLEGSEALCYAMMLQRMLHISGKSHSSHHRDGASWSFWCDL
jgi:hypothetical protein